MTANVELLRAENKRLANALQSLLRYVERCREAGVLVCDDIGPEEFARYELEQALSLPPEQPAAAQQGQAVEPAPPSAPVGAAEDMVLDAIERRESSAPVGVDAPGSRAWMAEVCRAAALSLAAHGVRNDQLSKVADWIAQQSAAVGRNPAHAWPAVDRLLIDAYNAGTDGTELDLIAARRKIAALAQQPAAVDRVVGTVTRVGSFEVLEHRIELDPEFDERLNNMPEGTVVRLYAAPVRDLTQKQLADAAATLATQHQEPKS